MAAEAARFVEKDLARILDACAEVLADLTALSNSRCADFVSEARSALCERLRV